MRRLTRAKSVRKLSARTPRWVERVVEAHLDVRMCVECRDRRVEPRGVHVVEQQAHAHAALRGPPERLEEQMARRVAVPDVVLHVERAVRDPGEQDACREGIARIRKREDAGLARMRGNVRGDRAAQPRPRGVGQRGGCNPALRWRQGRAACDQRSKTGDQDRKEAAHSNSSGKCRTAILAINGRAIAVCRHRQRAMRMVPGDDGTMSRDVAGVASSVRTTKRKKRGRICMRPRGSCGGRYWVRTSDPCRVKAVLYR